MKKTWFFCLSALIWSQVSPAQNPDDWQLIKFEKAEDFKANEGSALECARFILDMPAEAGNPARKIAMALLAKWVSGTPDYNFIIGEHVARLMKNNEAILGLYMAAMTRYVLENKDKAPSEKDVELHSFESLLEYCENSNNKVPETKELKKAIKAKNSGKLEGYLSS
jgi:hypothetical protein